MIAPLLLPPAKPLPEGLEELAVLEDARFENGSFSKRLITGAAAEGFFESTFSELPDFIGHSLTNVTRFGCGFDFRLQPVESASFLAVEVKGIAAASGEIMLTSKEHKVATYLGNRYFLCVVRNFTESPVISLFRNPLGQGLGFIPRERKKTSRTWHARISA